MTLTWVIEHDAFPSTCSTLNAAIDSVGQRRIDWSDDWWNADSLPKFINAEKIVFRGSLENAHRIARESCWYPGAYCVTNEFYCSKYYDRTKYWLLPQLWTFTTAKNLVENPFDIAGDLAKENKIFVRPDGQSKPD